MASKWLKFNPFFIVRPQLRRLTFPEVAQLITGRVDVEYIAKQYVLRNVSSRSFGLPLSGSFYRCFASMYLLIYHWQYVYVWVQQHSEVLTQIKHIYPIITNAKPGGGTTLSANATANGKMTTLSWVSPVHARDIRGMKGPETVMTLS
jgi:hypothetical protein